MARPKKTGLDYFPFDVDFFEDEKIVCIAGEFGIKGEITAIKLLCALYRNGYFIEWNDKMKMKMLRSLPGVSTELFDQILNRLVRWGFFDKNLFDSVRVLTSRGIQQRFFEAAKRRKTDEEPPYLLIDADKNKVNVCNNRVNVDNNRVNVGNNPQRKDNSKLLSYSFKDNTTTPPAGARACEGGKGLPVYNKLLESSLKSKPWLETLCMNYHMGMVGAGGLRRRRVQVCIVPWPRRLYARG